MTTTTTNQGGPIESERRKPGFCPGFPVTLDDGQAWQVPSPTIIKAKLHPRQTPDGVKLVKRLEFTPEWDAEYMGLIDRLIDCVYLHEQRLIFAALAFNLLSRNYDLTPLEFEGLLSFPADDSEPIPDYWVLVASAALGTKAPKPIAVG